MADNKFLEDSLLNLTSKVDQGFQQINERLTKQDLMLVEHRAMLSAHSKDDMAAQNRVDRLEARLNEAEKPAKWFKGFLATSGVIGGLASAGYYVARLLKLLP